MKRDIEKSLAIHRDQIDKIDQSILDLMNQRVAIAKLIGDLKSSLPQPAYCRPEREAQLLRNLMTLNKGPMEDVEVERLFREIISIARGTEATLSISVLGPSGTYTEMAAKQHFGSSVGVVLSSTIDDIFRSTEVGRTDFAVVPVENSTEGGVNATLDRLVSTSLTICGEVNLKIHHNLLGIGAELATVERVYAHSQSLGQCKRWLDMHLPHTELVPVSSNAEAAKKAGQDKNAAAIAGDAAAEIYQLNVLAGSIEDEPGNTTRFLILSNRRTTSSGDDKTSLLLSCRHRPGALFHLLKPLSDQNIDMTKIESRPSRTGLWEYVFFVDIKGHMDDDEVCQALEQLKREAGLFKALGSYPVSI